MTDFARVLRILRTNKGLSQQALADKLGISKSAVNMYERGEREPSFETLELIADFFNVDIDYLLGRTNKTTVLTGIIKKCHSNDNSNETVQNSISSRERRLLAYYNALNDKGKLEAAKRLQELTHLEQYATDDTTLLNAAHAIENASSEDKQYDEDIMNDENF